jgi:hypothetical protein
MMPAVPEEGNLSPAAGAVGALAAVKAACAADIKLSLDGGRILLAPRTAPPNVFVALLKAADRGELVRILAARQAGAEALRAEWPGDVTPRRWLEAIRGLERFLAGGHADEAIAAGWPSDELFRPPDL